MKLRSETCASIYTCNFPPRAVCDATRQHHHSTRVMFAFFFFFLKKNLFLYFWHKFIFCFYFYFIFFSHHIWKPERKAKAKTNTNDWYVYFHYFGHQGWEKLLEISHTCVENCMYARASLEFISCCKPTKWSQSSGWLQPQSSPKVTISIYVIWWKLLFHSTILFSHFPRLYKANSIKLPPKIQWCD